MGQCWLRRPLSFTCLVQFFWKSGGLLTRKPFLLQGEASLPWVAVSKAGMPCARPLGAHSQRCQQQLQSTF